MNKEELKPCRTSQRITIRGKFFKEKGIRWLNSQDEPDIEYVEWLEDLYWNTRKGGSDAENGS